MKKKIRIIKEIPENILRLKVHCRNCRTHQEVKNKIVIRTQKKGIRTCLKGVCEVCGKKVYQAIRNKMNRQPSEVKVISPVIYDLLDSRDIKTNIAIKY